MTRRQKWFQTRMLNMANILGYLTKNVTGISMDLTKKNPSMLIHNKNCSIAAYIDYEDLTIMSNNIVEHRLLNKAW